MQKNETNGAVSTAAPGAAVTGGSTAGTGLPEVVGYRKMMEITKRSYATVTRWASRGEFRPGVYMGRGMFNMRQLRYWTDKSGTFLMDAKQ